MPSRGRRGSPRSVDGALPAVADVGGLLLVARPVGKTYGAEDPRFVEPHPTEVALKAPQLEPVDPASCSLDQCGSRAPPDLIGPGIEKPDLLILPREKG